VKRQNRNGTQAQTVGKTPLPERAAFPEPLRSKWQTLETSFFEPAADVVAPALLGRWLIRRLGEELCGGLIVETEAYLVGDPACHAYRGETQRNRIMWGPPGHAYVYFIYGNHFCVNAVCRPRGIAEAVLIRALEPSLGVDGMRLRRLGMPDHQLTNGPGKLCAALDIDRSLDGANLCDSASPLFIADHPDRARFLEATGPIVSSQRIGITKAAHLPLRFYLKRSAFISRR
jgi:DNA-3-methyladenine glycosylase